MIHSVPYLSTQFLPCGYLLAYNITTSLTAKTTHIYHLPVSLGPLLHGFSLGCKVSAKVEVVSESSAGEGSISTFTQIVDRIQFLKGCLTEGLSFPLAVGQRPRLQGLTVWASLAWPFTLPKCASKVHNVRIR